MVGHKNITESLMGESGYINDRSIPCLSLHVTNVISLALLCGKVLRSCVNYSGSY